MIGTTVSHYYIEGKIGGGAMGQVYRARDTRLGRTVALKFLSPDLVGDAAARKRFTAEARSASALQHNNICTVHDIGQTSAGGMFICMDCYDGRSLASMVAGGRLPADTAIDLACQIADGLAAAHDAGVVHRDIKPANVIVTHDGVAKILDFGLAKLSGSTRVTRTGVTVGTVSYMSPEQASGEQVDKRADIWSLGVVLYEMLTGALPFASDHSAAVMFLIANRNPKPLSAHCGALPEGLQRVIDKTLHKDPDRRYPSAREFRDDLVRIAEGLRPRAYRYRLVGRMATVAVAVAAVIALWPPLVNMFRGDSQPPLVAVLPFESVGEDTADRAFCDGLVETLTSQLSQLEQPGRNLWVVPASEVRSSNVKSPREARRAFGADIVLAGSVQRLPGVYRVNLSLSEVNRSGQARQLHADTFDENVITAADLQDRTVRRVMNLLDIPVQPRAEEALARGGTSESAAYRLYVQGRGYLQRHESDQNIERAIDQFKAATLLDSLYALAHAGLGEAYWYRYSNTRDPNWIAPAVVNCERALEIDDHLAAAYTTLGMIHAGTGDPESAVHEFDRALEIDPTSADTYRGLATAYVRLGEKERAESTYRRAIRMKPAYWDGYNKLGWFYFREGRYDDAAEQFGKVVELTPDNTLGYNNLGACYLTKGDLVRAREHFERSIAVEANDRAYSNLSVIHYLEGRYEEAAKMAEAALALNDASYKAWVNLGNPLYWLKGRREEAQDAYREAAKRAENELNRTPDDAHLMSSLAGFYAILGQKDRAAALAVRAIDSTPDNARVCYFVGHAFEQIGDRDRALTYIARALDGGYTVTEMKTDPFLKGLVSDERFQQLARKYDEKGE